MQRTKSSHFRWRNNSLSVHPIHDSKWIPKWEKNLPLCHLSSKTTMEKKARGKEKKTGKIPWEHSSILPPKYYDCQSLLGRGTAEEKRVRKCMACIPPGRVHLRKDKMLLCYPSSGFIGEVTGAEATQHSKPLCCPRLEKEEMAK